MFLDFVQKPANIQLFNQSRKRTLPFSPYPAKPVARKLVGRILCKYGSKNSVLGHFWSQTCYRRACGALFLQVWHYLGDSRFVVFRVI